MSNLFETVKGILEEDKRFLSTDGTIMRNALVVSLTVRMTIFPSS